MFSLVCSHMHTHTHTPYTETQHLRERWIPRWMHGIERNSGNANERTALSQHTEYVTPSDGIHFISNLNACIVSHFPCKRTWLTKDTLTATLLIILLIKCWLECEYQFLTFVCYVAFAFHWIFHSHGTAHSISVLQTFPQNLQFLHSFSQQRFVEDFAIESKKKTIRWNLHSDGTFKFRTGWIWSDTIRSNSLNVTFVGVEFDGPVAYSMPECIPRLI